MITCLHAPYLQREVTGWLPSEGLREDQYEATANAKI